MRCWDCGSARPAEAVGGLEWTGRWPGAKASEISHLHRAGVMTMSSLPPAQLAARRRWHGAWVDLKQAHTIWNVRLTVRKGCWACPMAEAKRSHWQPGALLRLPSAGGSGLDLSVLSDRCTVIPAPAVPKACRHGRWVGPGRCWPAATVALSVRDRTQSTLMNTHRRVTPDSGQSR